MDTPFNDDIEQVADGMGVSLYQRFTEQEASLFLRCSLDALKDIRASGAIEFIQIADSQVEYLGHQLVRYLLSNVVKQTTLPTGTRDRIVRIGEVQKLTGLSRTTIWRYEKTGNFPARVPLGPSAVGWRLSEIEAWISAR